MGWMGIRGEEREVGDGSHWVGNVSRWSQIRSGKFLAGGWGIAGRVGTQMATFYFFSTSELLVNLQDPSGMPLPCETFFKVCSECWHPSVPSSSVSFHTLVPSFPIAFSSRLWALKGLQSDMPWHWPSFPNPKLSHVAWHGVHHMVWAKAQSIWNEDHLGKSRTHGKNVLKVPCAPSQWNLVLFILLPYFQIPGFLPSLIWRCIFAEMIHFIKFLQAKQEEACI